VCLGDTGTARRALGQAASLREELGETGAAAVSRRNLGFVVTTVSDEGRTVSDEGRRERSTRPFDDIGDDDSLLLHDVAKATRARSRMSETGALLITFLMCAALGGFTYSIIQEYDPEQPVAPATAATSAPLHTTGDSPTATPAAQTEPDTRRANILIFTARPGSIVTKRPTDLCYAVSGALRTRIEPAIGDVEPVDALTCRRVAPVRTTTYELTAVGGDGIPVSQQVVIVVR
jgi:hypothetical protein